MSFLLQQVTSNATSNNYETQETFAILTGGQNEYQVHIGEIGLFFGNTGKNSCLSEITLPYPMYDHMAVVVENTLVLCGGFIGPSEVMTSKCHKFNKSSNTWAPLPDLPSPIIDSSLVSNGNNYNLF